MNYYEKLYIGKLAPVWKISIFLAGLNEITFYFKLMYSCQLKITTGYL